MDSQTQTDGNVDMPPENPCKCLHINESPKEEKPKVRPCKYELPKQSSSSDAKEKRQCQTQQEPRPQPGTAQFPLKEYLDETVAPILMDGFQAVLQKLPPEPIPFLEEFFAKRKNECKNNLPPHL